MHTSLRPLFLLIPAMAALEAGAQKTEFGIFGGPQITTAHYRLHSQLQTTTWKTGVHLGAIASIPFEGNFYFTPSLSYSLKGFGVTLTDTSSNPGTEAVGNTVRLHVMELAPLFTIYFSSGGTRPFVQFGPAIDYAVFGTEDVRLKNGNTVGRTMTFSYDAYGRVTASVIIRLGFETPGGFFANAHYDHGLGSLNQNDFGPTITNRVVGISVGKFFRRP
jgi:hypothetical protein